MYTLNCRGRILIIDKPIIMGVINITPDSFFDGSRQIAIKDIVLKAEQMLHEGATIIDIGGQSTRPGSNDVGAAEEIERVIPAIESILQKFPECILSIDTYHSEVVKEAAMAGVQIVNDISSGTLDSNMITTVAALQMPYIAMHLKGTPATMQNETNYDDLLLDILEFFIHKTNECRQAGIKDVIIDPGFGFAKNIEQNFALLKHLSVFKMLQKPILAGLSRKSTIYKTLDTTADKALNGTTVMNTIALQNGANILRVHDVKEAVETVKLVNAYSNS